MRAWIVFVVACSFPTKHAGSTSDAPMQTGDGSAQIDTMRMIDGAIDAPPPPSKRVFVSSVLVTGGLNGVAGADSMCNSFAASVNLGGTWIAWISDPNTPIFARITPSPRPYTLVDRITIVAQNYQDLTDGQIAHPIDHDERGQIAVNPLNVWTATSPTANYVGPDCNNWLDGGPLFQGIVGNFTQVAGPWTAGPQAQCAQQNHIYCIEQ